MTDDKRREGELHYLGRTAGICALGRDLFGEDEIWEEEMLNAASNPELREVNSRDREFAVIKYVFNQDDSPDYLSN